MVPGIPIAILLVASMSIAAYHSEPVKKFDRGVKHVATKVCHGVKKVVKKL